jgi:hypothetical protein
VAVASRSSASTGASRCEAEPRRGVFRREGGIFRVSLGREQALLKASRGLDHLAFLLRHPDRDLHVRELARPDAAAADRPLRERLSDLREALAEANGCNDLGKSTLTRVELEDLEERLARSAGHGEASVPGRADVERTRVAVTKAIHIAFRAIGGHAPGLRRYLVNSIHTGRLCRYQPDPTAPVVWEL